MSKYDLIVLGGGPGGYVAAIRAAQLGLQTALIDKSQRLGGTCLNIGCIPSKILLDSSELYARIQNESKQHGIRVESPIIDIPAMQTRKNAIVKKLTRGVDMLMKTNKVRVYSGVGVPQGDNTVCVTQNNSMETLQYKDLLIATGSEPVVLDALPCDGKTIVNSTDALSFDSVPEHLLLIGGGIIGLELGSVWLRFGSKVTVVELRPEIMNEWDMQVAQTMRRELRKQGMNFVMNTTIVSGKVVKGKAVLAGVTDQKDTVSLVADKVLVAVGRCPYTQKLEKIGLAMDGKHIRIQDTFATTVPHVWAIGDVVRGPMLAHKAEEEGIAAAEIIAGKPGYVNYNTIPNVIYTVPEAASVGKTEEQLKSDGIEYKTGMFSFAANGRALAMNVSSGFVKILAHKQTDTVLGVHIVGPWASTLIAEVGMVMEFGGSAEDIARSVHAHPTLSEVIKEAALGIDGRMIHGKN